jgi:hypothetical protein
MNMVEEYDTIEGRCRMLGHQVPFSYCRLLNSGLPCSRILDCWFERFDIEDFMKRHYSEEELKKILSPPKPKITTLIELIEKARGR